jgi:hypothetical protein
LQIKAILVFAMHQFMGTIGVAFTAATGIFCAFEILRPINPGLFTSRNASWILTGLPWFPLQIGTALWVGWTLSRRFHHRSMLWVWVLPFAFLFYALLAIPTMTPSVVPPMFQAGVGQSRLSHYFGWGCRPDDRCTDQLGITMPFYASVFHSVGAFFGRR